MCVGQGNGGLQDNEAAVPIAHIEPIADAHRMMAAVRGAFPGRLLATRGPLARHPPAANLLRLGRLLEVDDGDDVAEIAVELGRAINVAAVEGETVHAARRP